MPRRKATLRDAMRREVLRRADRRAEQVQHPRRGGDELLGIDLQPVQDLRRLTVDVPALVLADHPSGRIHEFQIIVEQSA